MQQCRQCKGGYYYYTNCDANFQIDFNAIYRHWRSHTIRYYISVFAKMQFFKISVILCFSVDLLYFLYIFFSREFFSAVCGPICTKFGTNCMRIILRRAIFEKFKNQVTTAKKHRKIGQIFTPAIKLSLVATKQLRIFEKSYLRYHLGCYTFQKIC